MRHPSFVTAILLLAPLVAVAAPTTTADSSGDRCLDASRIACDHPAGIAEMRPHRRLTARDVAEQARDYPIERW